ncbi:GrpB family protein [Clostridium sp. 19966]|uniref:GrpB family protein n=1 Tax=Clostridium sp. 19966 TaxID=2768166 RepID=UPI0028E484E9|nr:GrpB family protein [Clostridium sp. 19966]
MIVVNDINQIDEYNYIMEIHVYSARGENGIEGRRYFVKLNQDNSENYTHHIHIYQKRNPHISDELMFRDYLKIDNEALKEYERVKIAAALKFRYSPQEYVHAKYDCIKSIMNKAKSYYKNK